MTRWFAWVRVLAADIRTQQRLPGRLSPLTTRWMPGTPTPLNSASWTSPSRRDSLSETRCTMLEPSDARTGFLDSLHRREGDSRPMVARARLLVARSVHWLYRQRVLRVAAVLAAHLLPVPIANYLAFCSESGLRTWRRARSRDRSRPGVPCLTLRENTERPVTEHEGTNVIVGASGAKLVAEARTLATNGSRGNQSPRRRHWEGRAAERIVDVLLGARA